MNRTLLFAVTALSAAAALPALAQQPAPMPMHQGMAMPATPKPATGDASASSQAFKAADDKMMQDMAMPMTGDTDRDFVAGMIPHHAGAIDMAEIELKYGKDPKLRTLARNIIAAQKKEIAEMKAWQAAHR